MVSTGYVPLLLAQLHRSCPNSNHAMTTRSKARIFKPKCFHASVSGVTFDYVSQQPTTIVAALLDSNSKKAMDEEYNALIKNGT